MTKIFKGFGEILETLDLEMGEDILIRKTFNDEIVIQTKGTLYNIKEVSRVADRKGVHVHYKDSKLVFLVDGYYG